MLMKSYGKEKDMTMPVDLYYTHEYPDTTTVNTAAIITAIRCQKNYYRTDVVTTDIVDPDASNCYICPFYKKNANCDHECNQKQFIRKQVRTYINERNRFGYKKELPALAIKLFLYLHFLRSDRHGYLRLEVNETSEVLSCSRRSVVRNLETLSRRGYISYAKGVFAGTYQVFLLSASENKKTAAQGGRGYFVLSYDMFQILLGCKTINELRLQLRGVVSTLEGTTKNQILQETSYADVKRMLPAYATKKFIRNTITSEHFLQMFGVKLSKEHSFFYITMKEEYNPIRIKADKVANARNSIEDVMNQMNASITKTNKKFKTHVPLLSLTKEDIQDVAKISLQLPISCITQALSRFHESYVKRGERVRSVGAMVRTIAWDIYGYQQLNPST